MADLKEDHKARLNALVESEVGEVQGANEALTDELQAALDKISALDERFQKLSEQYKQAATAAIGEFDDAVLHAECERRA